MQTAPGKVEIVPLLKSNQDKKKIRPTCRIRILIV